MGLRIDEQRDDVPCPECEGVGCVRVIYGDEEACDPCGACGGSGRVILIERAPRDLRLIPEVTHDERDVMGNESGKEAA